MSVKDVTPALIGDMKALVDSGDLDLKERRATFKRIQKRDTVLDDEHLLRAIAATDDDDDELFCDNVCEVERE